jgi:hypothetical protein
MARRRSVVADDAIAEDEVVQRRTAVERPPWSPAQLVALLIGVLFTVIGGIALSKTGVHTSAMNTIHTDAPLWDHTAWLALVELAFGLMMIGAGVVPGGARGFMTFIGIIALAFGIAVLVAPDSMHRTFGAEASTGWVFIITAGVTLIAAAVSPVFFTGERMRYGRRREVVA